MYKVKMVNRKTGESILSLESFESRSLASEYIARNSVDAENIDFSIVTEHEEEEMEQSKNQVDKEKWSEIYHRYQYTTKPLILNTKPSILYVNFTKKNLIASFETRDPATVCKTCDRYHEICKCKYKRK